MFGSRKRLLERLEAGQREILERLEALEKAREGGEREAQEGAWLQEGIDNILAYQAGSRKEERR